jgi:capsular exopolysaccharide synthesis family protein
VARPRALEEGPARERLDLDEHLASVLSPNSFEADQYRVLRHFLEQARAQKKLDVVAVTSPGAGDGKTLTAVNLALTLAQSRRSRVLLADADLRRPLVAANLGLDDGGPGLVGALLDAQLELGDVVRRLPLHLDVLPAGPPPADAYHVLESPRVGELIERARAAYDTVVLDMPPMLLVPDCRLLSQWIDGFLVVVAAHRTPRRLLADTLSALDQARVVGIVFNGDDRPLHGYYGGYYGDYHRPRQSQEPRWRRWWPWQRHARRARRHSWR